MVGNVSNRHARYWPRPRPPQLSAHWPSIPGSRRGTGGCSGLRPVSPVASSRGLVSWTEPAVPSALRFRRASVTDYSLTPSMPARGVWFSYLALSLRRPAAVATDVWPAAVQVAQAQESARPLVGGFAAYGLSRLGCWHMVALDAGQPVCGRPSGSSGGGACSPLCRLPYSPPAGATALLGAVRRLRPGRSVLILPASLCSELARGLRPRLYAHTGNDDPDPAVVGCATLGEGFIALVARAPATASTGAGWRLVRPRGVQAVGLATFRQPGCVSCWSAPGWAWSSWMSRSDQLVTIE